MENEIEVIEINPGDLILFQVDRDNNPFCSEEITLGVVETGYDFDSPAGVFGYPFTFESLRFLGKPNYKNYSARSYHVLKNFGPLEKNVKMLRYLAEDINIWDKARSK